MVHKKCEICDTLMEKVHHAKKYCNKCRKEALSKNQKRHHAKFKDIKKESNERLLKDNFNKVIKKPYHLTGKGFNSVSEIKCKAYTQFLSKKWIEVLKEYNKYDDLLDYIVNEYRDYYEQTGKVGMKGFTDWNKYCTYDLLNDIGADTLKEKASIQKLRYTDKDLVSNLNMIIDIVGNPPIYTEFQEHTKITLITYVNRYNLKGKVYDQLMKLLLDDEQYDVYLNRYFKHKSQVGRETGILSAKYDDDDYEFEFKRIFNMCLEDYGEFPTRRLFDKLSRIDSSSYRQKYNRGWLSVCEMYGYEVERNHTSEKMLLNIISELTGEKYKPQKTWGWLIGVGGKNMYCDGYFSRLKLVVEFDGRQHRTPVDAFGGIKSFIRLQENDKLKEEILNENEIKLIRIASNTNWYDKEYIKDVLTANDIPILENIIIN